MEAKDKKRNTRSKLTIALISFSLDDYNLSFGNIVHYYAKEHDCNFLVFLTSYGGNSNSIEEITDNINNLITRHCVDGLIILSSALSSYFPWDSVQTFIESFDPLPVVLVGNEIPGYPCVIEDNRAGMGALIRHMVDEHGYRRIVFIRGPLTNSEGDERLKGYRDVLDEFGIEYDPKLVVSGDFDFDLSSDESKEALNSLLDDELPNIDAIACSSDYMAYTVIKELNRRGISVPEDIGVSGFDNAGICTMMIPALTTVDQNREEQGRGAASLLLKRIADNDFCETRLIRTRPVIRRSCNCFSLPDSAIDVKECAKRDGDLKNCILQSLGKDRELGALSMKHGANLEEKALMILDEYLDLHSEDIIQVIGKLETFIVGDVRNNNNGELWILLISRIAELTMALEPCTPIIHFRYFYSLINIAAKLAKTMQLVKIMDLRNEEIVFNSMLESFVSCNDYESFVEIISGYLPRLGVNSCYICLYNEGDIGEARLLYGYNSRLDKMYENDETFFPVSMLVPDYVDLFEERATFIFRDLLLRDNACGYLLFERETIDIEVQAKIYEGLSHQISAVIGQINLHDRIRDYSRRLEQKVAERTLQLTETNKKLKKLDSVKNDFIANITHDFRSPLTVILNVADLELNLKKDSPCRKEFEMILASAYRMKHFVDRLLDLAKLDAAAIDIRVSKIDLADFLDTVTGYYTKATEGTGISISVELPGKLRDDFYSDVEKLDEVVSNIISNALKHVDSEKGRIEVSVEYEDEHCLISIADNGSGISREYLKDIFNRFKQLETGRDTRYGGSGIGLAFAKQLTQFMKGDIWAESEGPGCGSVFKIRLPLGNVFENYEYSDTGDLSFQKEMRNTLAGVEVKQKLQKDEFYPEITEQNGEDEYNIYKSLILIADDEVQIAELIKNYLVKNGYKNFIIASGGGSALQALDTYSPDIVICDYNMPEVRGSEVLKKLMQDPVKKEIPFVFLSAVADENLIIEQKGKGAREYLEKPIVEKELLCTVEHYLGIYFKSRQAAHETVPEPVPVSRDQLMSYLYKVLSMRRWVDCSLVMMRVQGDNRENGSGNASGAGVLSSLHEILREYDMSGLYEKDTVLIILPETSEENCAIVIDKIAARLSHLDSENRTSISCRFGVSSLVSDKAALERDLGIEDLISIYEVEHSENTNWDLIRTYKRAIVMKLIQYAKSALAGAEQETSHIVRYADMDDKNQG